MGERQGDQLGRGADLRAVGEAVKGAAPCVPHPNPAALPASVDPVADGVDHPCPVAMRNDAAVGHDRAAKAGALLVIGGVDARSADPNQHFAGAGHRLGNIADAQHLAGRTGPAIPGLTHQPASLGNARSMKLLTMRWNAAGSSAGGLWPDCSNTTSSAAGMPAAISSLHFTGVIQS